MDYIKKKLQILDHHNNFIVEEKSMAAYEFFLSERRVISFVLQI